MIETRKVCFLIGTRPEAIKCWPLIEALRSCPWAKVQVVLSGQHRELLHQAVAHLGLPVTADLNVMTAAQSLESLTARLIEGIASALRDLKPDCVIVQGDTTTVFVGALAGFYAGIPVGHLEAGLRSADLRHPFPEELNRRLTTVTADWHFAPTGTAREALRAEGVPGEAIFVTGNTGIDALRIMRDRLESYPPTQALADALAGGEGPLIAVTVHRRENQPFMTGMAESFRDILHDVPAARIVFPVHLSPAVRAAFEPVLRDVPRCHLIEPLDYANFVRLLCAAKLVLTDSGGVQEEAPFLGKPVLVMRRTTERPEAVTAGVVKLIGEDRRRIAAEVSALLTDDRAYAAMARSTSPYGDGHAAQRIAKLLHDLLGRA